MNAPPRRRSGRGPLLIIAVLLGVICAWVDSGAAEVQSAVLLLMGANFVLTLPGAASPLEAAAGSFAGFVAARTLIALQFDAGLLLSAAPCIIAAIGGSQLGRLLDASPVDSATSYEAAAASSRWDAPLRRRPAFAVALLSIAAVGTPVVVSVLRNAGHPAARGLGAVWQILTLMFWIVCTRMLYRRRGDSPPSPAPTVAAVARHGLLITSGIAVHAVLIVLVPALLLVPMTPSALALGRAALVAYIPLDALAYTTMAALAYATDTQRRIREAEREAAAARAAVTSARLAALRARLDPHFLFNVLNSVIVLARRGSTAETAQTLESLTDLLRYVLDDRRALVSLEEEMAFVSSYLALQKLRYADRLRVTLQIPDTVRTMLVPQLILQPLVENAVEHGIGSNVDGGELRITAAADSEFLAIDVEDDGRGPGAHRDGFGLGLSNTRQRLLELYGASASVSLTARREGRGMHAALRIPVQAVKENADE